ncbi:MAG: thioesterase family protein [Oligoflexia bacterium]|nr:thioesterase family protein [Oligoflexia bacterium]
MQPLDESCQEGVRIVQAEVLASWSQGRAAFGGLVTGLCLRAVQGQVAPDRLLRSVLVDFAGPVRPGPVRIELSVLRRGRAITQTQARLFQGGRVCAVLIAAWGRARTTAMPRVPPSPAPAWPSPETLAEIPAVEGITPAFTQHLDYRWASGVFPFSASDRAEAMGWVRLRDDHPVDIAGALALADAWPAPVLALLHSPAAASTVTWMVNVITPLPVGGIAPEGWWRFKSQAGSTANGYADVTGSLWAPNGELVLESRQLVAEFSRG